MAKYKEIVSMVLDMLKVTSDDSIFNEGHIIFLAGRYRSFLLKQRYSTDLKKQIPESNYQTLCLELERAEAIEGMPCESDGLETVYSLNGMRLQGTTPTQKGIVVVKKDGQTRKVVKP